MSTIAIGDIHGNLSALVDLLNQIRRECGRTDTVVFLGDYIDRGPDSKGCVDAILEFRTEVPAEVLCLLGNHEDWMLRSMRDHRSHSWLLGMGALTTIDSYSTDAALTIGEAVARLGANVYLERETLPYEVFFDSMPEDHRRFFESLGLFHQTPDCAAPMAAWIPAWLASRISAATISSGAQAISPTGTKATRSSSTVTATTRPSPTIANRHHGSSAARSASIRSRMAC